MLWCTTLMLAHCPKQCLLMWSVLPSTIAVAVKMSVGIKGVVPGEATEEYLQRQMLLCKFWVGVMGGCHGKVLCCDPAQGCVNCQPL